VHIPDGLMDPTVAGIGWIEFVIVISAAILLSSKRLKEKDLPRVAMFSAGIFVAQIINFPIGGGTTGHLIGGALFAIMVGPVQAMIGMSVVILIQALLFGDGGITALGLNAINMAVIAPLSGWGIYSLIKALAGDVSRTGEWLSLALAAWGSVFLAAAACAGELLVSYAVSGGSYGIASTISVPSMLGYHAVIGAGEAAISVGLISYLRFVAPELVARPRGSAVRASGIGNRIVTPTVLGALAIMLAFAIALPFYFLYASEGKDGLEQTMADAGTQEDEPLLTSPFSYGVSYFETMFAGILGFTTTMVVAVFVTKGLGLRKGGDGEG
jgi:cobalt/nickel transport system permease protein